VSNAIVVANKNQRDIIFALQNVVWNAHFKVGCGRLSWSSRLVSVLFYLAEMW
jgi:hypothetical protein